MAGAKQHVLPRFLQKGFASRLVKRPNRQDFVYTWVYRKGVEPFESKTENVGFEKDFYNEGELNVDDEITDLERSFAVMLDELRAKDDGYKIRSPDIADFVGHLSIRTKHLRDTLIDTAEVFSTMMFEYLADYKKLRAVSLEYHKRHPEVIRKALDEHLNKMPLTRFERLRAREAALLKVRPENIVALMDKDQSEYEFIFGALGPVMLEKIPAIAREGHVKALAKSLIPEPRRDEFRSLHWFVCKSSNALILGDVGCLFEVAGPKQYMALSSKADELTAIYLPISSDTLIVGTRSVSKPQVDFNALNQTFAEYSREFFICRESSNEKRNFQLLLGKKAQLFSDAEMETLMNEGFNEA